MRLDTDPVSFVRGSLQRWRCGRARPNAANNACVYIAPTLIQVRHLITLYGVGTMLWLTVLSCIEVSQADPFVGLGFVLTAVLGYALFGNALGLQRILGTLL